jgi:hypothetical protein
MSEKQNQGVKNQLNNASTKTESAVTENKSNPTTEQTLEKGSNLKENAGNFFCMVLCGVNTLTQIPTNITGPFALCFLSCLCSEHKYYMKDDTQVTFCLPLERTAWGNPHAEKAKDANCCGGFFVPAAMTQYHYAQLTKGCCRESQHPVSVRPVQMG